jgi:ABC-type spermidine/putrescine transport system permease subunit I
VPDHRPGVARPAKRGGGPGRLLLLAPGLAVLVPFFLAPLGIMLAYSVYRFVPGGQQVRAFTPENYARFLFDGFYASILADTLLMGWR